MNVNIMYDTSCMVKYQNELRALSQSGSESVREIISKYAHLKKDASIGHFQTVLRSSCFYNSPECMLIRTGKTNLAKGKSTP